MISKIFIEILKLQSYAKRMGIKGLVRRFFYMCNQSETTYIKWSKKHQLSVKELKKQRMQDQKWHLEIDILLWESSDTKKFKYLKQSLKNQSVAYGNVCSDINEIKNEYVLVCAEDVALMPDTMYRFKSSIIKNPDVDLIYGDGEQYINKEFIFPVFKPDYSQAYLYSQNYIGNVFLIKTMLLKNIEKSAANLMNQNIYELLLRVTEKINNIKHIPEIISCHYQEVKIQPKLQKQLVDAHLKRQNIASQICMENTENICHVRYELQEKPLVSVVILNKDHQADLERCIQSLQTQTYQNLEILIVENHSSETEIFEYYQKIQKEDVRIHLLEWTKKFNYSAMNNFAVNKSSGKYVLLLNNDVALTDQRMMEKMLGQAQQPRVGVVGCKLLYPDGSIQHAGVIVGYEGVALHWFQGQKPEEHSYMNRSEITQDLSAVTAACMLVTKEVYNQAGGMDEQLAVAYNDIDFCLAVKQLGYHVIYDADAVGLHDESKSRGIEDTVKKMRRFNQEVNRFYKKWKFYFKKGDPYYNPNLSLSRWDSKYKI